MAEAIALVAVGSGETSQEEIDALLNDAYGDKDIELIVPVDKALYSKTVGNVVAWFNEDDVVQAVQTKGASLTRSSARLGSGVQEVDYFPNILNPKDFEDFDEVHVLVGVPEEMDDDEADLLADVVERALDFGFKVKDLTKGLDDVRLEDEPEPVEEQANPEPDPEPEEKPKPQRKSRAKKTEEPEEKPSDSAFSLPKEFQQERSSTNYEIDIVGNLLLDLQVAVTNGLEALAALRARNDAPVAPEGLHEPDTAQEEASEPEEDKPRGRGNPPPKRGRGRPRTNFEEKQIWDEDTEDWVKRPAGRIRKGTKTRTVNTETGEVIEEDTV